MTVMSSRRAVSLLAACLVATFILGFAQRADAQVVSLDPDYTASLFAHGLSLPVGGMIYRPATDDFLVTEESTGRILSVNATTGAVTLFANVSGLVTPTSGAYLWDLNIDSTGQVLAPAYDHGPVLRFDSAGT